MSVWMCARAELAGMPILKLGEPLFMWVPGEDDETDSWVPVTALGDAMPREWGRAEARVRVEEPGLLPGLEPGALLNVRRRLLVAPSMLDEVRGVLLEDRARGWMKSGTDNYAPYVPLRGWALDLRCPVHWVVHTDPTELCSGEPLPRPVLAGDAVRLTSAWDICDTGSIGVIDGSFSHPITHARITFNATVFRDDNHVSCSGGPGTFDLDVAELEPTGDTATVWCWQWRDGFPGRSNGMDFRITVPVWEWNPAARRGSSAG